MVTLRIFIATIFCRYTFVLEDPNEQVSDLSCVNAQLTEHPFARSSALVRGSSVEWSRPGSA
jgi:hypothetical protein